MKPSKRTVRRAMQAAAKEAIEKMATKLPIYSQLTVEHIVVTVRLEFASGYVHREIAGRVP